MDTINDIQKFITINDNNIQLINPITKPYKIISFIGDARIGKSTLINCFISFLYNKNISIFKSSNNSKNHCTIGIDMLLLETTDYNIT
jgi:GTPase SAR1 family protein